MRLSRSYASLLGLGVVKPRGRGRRTMLMVAGVLLLVYLGSSSYQAFEDDHDRGATQQLVMAATQTPRHPSQVFAGTDLSDVTIGIYNFMSPDCIANAIRAIRHYYPTVEIVVLEDAKYPLWDGDVDPDPSGGIQERPAPLTATNDVNRELLLQQSPVHVWTANHVRWYRNPPGVFDVGNGAGRNRLVELTKTKYYFQHDDDWRFNNHSDLGTMRDFLEHAGYDVIAGCYETTDVGFFARLDHVSMPGTLLQHGFQHRGVVEGFTGIVKTDVVDHTMLGRTERLMQTPWTEHNHADGEHFLLFINLWIEQAKVASTNRFRLIHGRECRTTKYDQHRFRFMEQWWLRGSVMLSDLRMLGFEDKKDSYLKIDRDWAERLLGGGVREDCGARGGVRC